MGELKRQMLLVYGYVQYGSFVANPGIFLGKNFVTQYKEGFG